MTAWAAYPARHAARTPHPFILILRKTGQNPVFCPNPGRVFPRGRLGKVLWFHGVHRLSGRAGRIGQKFAGYACARISWGCGGDVLTCNWSICALCAPRAPPVPSFPLFSVCWLLCRFARVLPRIAWVLPRLPSVPAFQSTS